MGLVDDSSILMSIKHLLNVDPEEMSFDNQIGMLINGEFMSLWQLGIGPEEGFSIHDADTRWADFSTDKTLIETVKQYVAMRVRLIFDPPGSSIVADSINSRIQELQFRLNCQAERHWKDESKDESDNPWADDYDEGFSNRRICTVEGENLTFFANTSDMPKGGNP